MPSLNFEISEGTPDTAYRMVREKFAELFNEKQIKQENRPRFFSYHTGWAKGNISLSTATHGTRVMGSAGAEGQWGGFVGGTVIVFVAFVLIYGVFGALIMLLVYFPIVIPIIVLIGGKQQKTFGSKLCTALQGTNFQQHS